MIADPKSRPPAPRREAVAFAEDDVATMIPKMRRSFTAGQSLKFLPASLSPPKARLQPANATNYNARVNPSDAATPIPRNSRIAAGLQAISRVILWLAAATILGVVPWLFGGNGPEGYWLIVYTGRACALPLLLWLAACALRRELPGAAFWIPLACWGLLSVQVLASTGNPSSVPQAPWVGNGFDAVAHREHLPSTAFYGATVAQSRLWLALGIAALALRCVGLGPRAKRSLLWLLVINAAVLAVAGIPSKFSGSMMILGRWQAPDWYFYSTFLYHNHWCAFALLAVAAAVALGVTYKNLAVRSGLALAACVIAASAPLSTSRLGTAAMIAFGLVVIVALVLRRWKSGPAKSKALPAIALSAVLGVGLVGAGAFYYYKVKGAPGGHRTWASIMSSNPFGIRQTLAEDTVPMFKAKPWFGWGLGAYGAAFKFYQRPETRIVHNQGRVTLYDHAHNDWIERGAELGLIGFSLFLAPGLAWLWLARHARPFPILELWLLAGCAGLLLFAFGDMVFVNRAVAAAFAFLLPLAVTPAIRTKAQ